ncbi:MAG TPA: nucleotidyltransferase domain-containing protein [Nitrososphaeraceae archaeon]|nr:nucleotidyltransferase domain-containing protein [Nitrososphaeraceae archaeon]
MSNISSEHLKIIDNCVNKIAKNNEIVGVCLYGSKVAGYSRPNSDFDIIVVLENYSFIVKYVYLKESKIEVSALLVDRQSLEKDARTAFLGEFVVGRLLHIYDAILNPDLFKRIETIYKKRVIIEEIFDIVRSNNILSTEISFPLDFIMFSKIKRRSLLYPNALYSYYKIYNCENASRNIDFALDGYRRALNEILNEDKELLDKNPSDNSLHISEKRILINKNGKIDSLKLGKKLQDLSSYLIHVYAGRVTFRYAVKEAQSKIKRQKKHELNLPLFMSSPRESYWKLPEGILILNSRRWLDIIANNVSFKRYSISNKRRLGNVDSRTICFTLKNHDDNNYKTIVVKQYAKTKGVKWAALNLWTSQGRRFKVDPLFRLGNEYKALRYIRNLGLNTPTIESVILGKRLLVTEFIKGNSLADIIQYSLNETDEYNNIDFIKAAGEQIATIHNDKSTLGNIKPKNLIIRGNSLYFTGVDQFGFHSGDPIWDIVQFICRGLKKTTDSTVASKVVRGFLFGYSNEITAEYIKRLSRSKRYIESFYPLISPTVARSIKREIRAFIC